MIGFTQILFLAGAAAVLGPLLIHLLARPRYRRVPFTMIQFLQFGQIQSQSKRNLQNLFILLLRCLIIVIIAVLFAGPRLVSKGVQEKHRTAYYLGLDNSMSMAYHDTEGSYLQKMIDRAEQYIASAPAQGLFNIYPLASGTSIRNVNKTDALACVRNLRLIARTATLEEFQDGLRNPRKGDQGADKVYAFLISDFTPKFLERLEEIEAPIPVDDFTCQSIGTRWAIDNQAIVDARAAWISEGKIQINATVANYGPKIQPRKLTCQLGKKELAGLDIQVPADRRQTFCLEFPLDQGDPKQWFPLELRLKGCDGLAADDTWFLALSIPETETTTLLVAGKEPRELFLLKTAFETLRTMNPRQTLVVRTVPFSQLKAADLSRSNIFVCTGISSSLNRLGEELKDFIQHGGRFITFVKKARVGEDFDVLWKAGALPALPEKFHEEQARLVSQPATMEPGNPLGAESDGARALESYRMARIILAGYFDCKPAENGACVWRLTNGNGFIYQKSLGKGSAVLINTSGDDSLGTLMKSPAAVPFCRYLLSRNDRLMVNSFFCGDRIELPATAKELRSEGQGEKTWVRLPDGKKAETTPVGANLILNYSRETGWVQTLSGPERYAGINLPAGETNMEKPGKDQLAEAMRRVFHHVTEKKEADPQLVDERSVKPIGKIFAWLLLGLLIAEPFISNRMKR
jgi:hypothetical protein